MLEQFSVAREAPGRRLKFFLVFLLFLFGWGAAGVFWGFLKPNLPCAVLLARGLGNHPGQVWEQAALSAVFSITGVNPGYLPGILEKGLPAVPAKEAGTAPAFAGGTAGREGEHPLQDEESAGNPVDFANRPVEAAFYHTHNAETYLPLHGKSKLQGENGGVSLVAGEMAKVLEEAGIRSIHDLTVHDHPDFPTSYIKSEATARRLVRENPALKALVDVHRDAGLSKKETVSVGGREVARILLIVGNGERLPNPHWRENYAFAQEIAHRLEEKYPGILKGVRLKPGRYNQHLSPRALLVEVGSDRNTLEEALGAARCFAAVLAELIREDRAGEYFGAEGES
ncbi:MAG: stage II sporulation protein P [Firmicutes bacterium]|nr:stage II sporulation protein P [Bacillota bacterium]